MIARMGGVVPPSALLLPISIRSRVVAIVVAGGLAAALSTAAGLLLEGYGWENYVPQDELPEGFMTWWFEKAVAVG